MIDEDWLEPWRERICLTVVTNNTDLKENGGVLVCSFGSSGDPVVDNEVVKHDVRKMPEVSLCGHDSVIITGLPPHNEKKFSGEGSGCRCGLLEVIHQYKKLLNRGSLQCKRSEYISSMRHRKNIHHIKRDADGEVFTPWLDDEFLRRKNVELVMPITYTTAFLTQEDGTVTLKIQLLLNTAQAPFSITKGVCEALSEQECNELLATYCMALTVDLKLFFEKKMAEAKANGMVPDFYGYTQLC